MAPEVVMSDRAESSEPSDYDNRADVWALGMPFILFINSKIINYYVSYYKNNCNYCQYCRPQYYSERNRFFSFLPTNKKYKPKEIKNI